MVTITVASIEWPKEGKKQGAIIDSTGKRWGVWADKVGTYQQFGTYEITYKTNKFRGATYYTIDTATLIGGNGVRPPPPIRNEGPAAPLSGLNSDDQRRMDIFVSVMINNSSFDPASAPEQELVDVINKFKRIWKRVYGPQPDPISSTRNHDINDDIPF